LIRAASHASIAPPTPSRPRPSHHAMTPGGSGRSLVAIRRGSGAAAEGSGDPADGGADAAEGAGGGSAQMVLAFGSKSAGTAGISETDESTVTNSPRSADSSAESMMSSTW